MAAAVLLACLSPFPTHAETDRAYVSARHQAAAEELAALVIQPDTMPERAEEFFASALAAYAQDRSLALLEKRYPGLLGAMMTAMRPALQRQLGRNVSGYLADLATLYAGNLSVEEIARAAAFLKSPAGVKVRIGLARNVQAAQARDVMKADFVSAQSFRDDARAASTAVYATLTPQEAAATDAFFASDVGRRLDALNDRKVQIDVKWANYVSPDIETEIGRSVVGAMVDHIARTDPQFARSLREKFRNGLP
jgi:hypothetical protein